MVVICCVAASVGLSLRFSSFGWLRAELREVYPGLFLTSRFLPVRRVGLNFVIDPSAWGDEGKLRDCVGTISVKFRSAGEVPGLFRRGAVLALDGDSTFTFHPSERRPTSTLYPPLRVFEDDGSVAIPLIKSGTQSAEDAWWVSMLRKPPGRRRVWFPDAVASEVSCGLGVSSAIAASFGLLTIAVRARRYRRRMRAAVCTACGYPIVAASQRCSECGSSRPPWRGDTVRAVKP